MVAVVVTVPNGVRVCVICLVWALYNNEPFMSLSNAVPVKAAFNTTLFCRSVISCAAYSKLVLVLVKLV